MSDTEELEEQTPTLLPSILTSIKKNLNIPEDVTAFDPDIIMHINTAFSKLNQMGVGPEETFMIEDKSTTWDEFYTNKDINMVRTYVWLDVRLVFDPPQASVLSALKETKSELEWRLNVADDDRLYEDLTEEVQNGIDDL